MPMELKDLPPVLKPAQVAELLNVSVSTVCNMEATGELHAYRFGKVIRFNRDEVLKLVGLKMPQENEVTSWLQSQLAQRLSAEN